MEYIARIKYVTSIQMLLNVFSRYCYIGTAPGGKDHVGKILSACYL